MRGRAWLVVLCATLLLGRAASGQTLSAEEIVARMIRHDAERRAALAEYASERTYRMDYKGPIGERHATMQVRMEFSAPDRKQFTVISESGSTVFCHQVIQKLMEGEREGALESNRLRSMLSPTNYNLKLAGDDRIDGVDAWVLEVAPKQESRFNYKGSVWVSKADYAVMRILGSPAKNPNFLMGASTFDYRYRRNGDFWLPLRNDTVSHLRIGGEIKLDVDYGEYRIVSAGPLGGVASAANRDGGPAGPAIKGLAVSLPQ